MPGDHKGSLLNASDVSDLPVLHFPQCGAIDFRQNSMRRIVLRNPLKRLFRPSVRFPKEPRGKGLTRFLAYENTRQFLDLCRNRWNCPQAPDQLALASEPSEWPNHQSSTELKGANPASRAPMPERIPDEIKSAGVGVQVQHPTFVRQGLAELEIR